MEYYKGENYKILVLYQGKIYQLCSNFFDINYILDINSLTPVEITTHLTDEGITYSIDEGEDVNGNE